MAPTKDEIIISPVETEQDLIQANYCVTEAFGRQANDSLWKSMNPGWDTQEGLANNAQKMIKRWKSTTTNNDGRPNTIFLKATLPDPEKLVEGYGDPFTGDTTEMLQGVEGTENRFATQMFRSFFKRRVEYVRQVSESGRRPPAILHLDLCAVDPAFQRRGIAGKLVQAGLEEAKERGDLECTTEGSAMGRAVYRKLGFKDEGVGDIKWEVEEEFEAREKPPNVFLRTGV